jgi:putative transposase
LGTGDASHQSPFEQHLERDNHAVKRVTRPMLGFKSFMAAEGTLAGIERMHTFKKGQIGGGEGEESLTLAEQF